MVRRIETDALKQAAVVSATVLDHAAVRDRKMPRQPRPLGAAGSGVNTRTE